MAKTINERLQKAAKAFEKQDFEKAEKHYRKALLAHPRNMGANMGLVMVLNRTQRSKEALNILKNVWEQAKANNEIPATAKATVLVQTAIAQQQLGMLKESLNSFRAAYSLTPTAELQAYIQKLQGLLESPQSLESIIEQAGQKRLAGELQAAAKLYEAALKMNADSPGALHGLGMTYRQLGSPDKALPFVQQAIILAPDRHDFYNDLGMLFQDRNDLKKAITFHKRALSYKPGFVPALINLGVAYKRSGMLDEAVASYRSAIEANPNIPEAYNNLGNLLRLQGDHEGAKACLMNALKLRPNYQDAMTNLRELEQALSA